ncbi:TIGR03757 family integrating conjugative element protein [Pseudomonas aeruginosa]|uniref:TIGR03757 family integrating conjugative element protein n=1 Tax=Pseudomonas aeruginosa TaxID=287 RepID=UPI000BB98BBD|nr:TIGR03757 family integrating conjugative element protein [Pseudomonas aeruginosa]ELC7284837.1 TIGR03757 family integrating conjugative element protein [Pseudomonas aeruginosa]ELM3823628.1 TIGR03757 family integrating conjugative element protein [Pseudomonas aeruginosa]ELN9534175.1 TIGR03757 family integrating conjugative element protein [Pseudomonas aeruginosa]MBH8744066.1 TIGR03757 family integrating conjugative element protein [Pseudomonas aeruginosa]MBX6107943.1 TIGR03757 family integrat
MQRSTIAITALLLTLAFPASAADIRVFTGRGHPVRGVPSDALVTELDASTRLEEDLGADLPADADQAAALVQRRLEKGGSALQRSLASAYQGVADAWGLGVAKVPAVVVDRRYVIYGEPDVALALSRIARYRREQP